MRVCSMILFDTHLHLDDEQFEGIVGGVVERARAAGVTTMVAVGTTADSSDRCVELAHEYDGVYAAVGIQPNYAAQAAEGDWDRIVELTREPKVVALGETGLDKYWDHSPLDVQQRYFDLHVRLSQQIGLPFIVHMRDCRDEMLAALAEAHERGPLSGVMHSFTGDAAMAERCVELGMYISFAGMVTYKKSAELREVAARIPEQRILIETDAPYLSPHPQRGQRPNEPALLVHTAACLAEVRGMSVEEFAALTTNNARTLFARVL